MKKIATLLLLGATALPLLAQTPAASTLEVNRVKAGFVTDGRLFTNGTTGQFVAPFAPGQPQRSLLRGAGLWMAGIDPGGNFKMSVSNSVGSDFKPGVLDPFTAVPSGLLTNGPWRVTQADIEQHLADFADNGVIDNPIASVFGWPGRDNSFFSQFNSGAQLPQTPQGLASFFDADGNGKYDPDNGDYPALAIRGCAIDQFPDEMVWFPIHDNVQHNVSASIPMLVEVHCTLFAYNCDNNNGLSNTIFAHYKLINRGFEALDSCYIGLFNDFTVGNVSDDYVGCDTVRNISYAYNADNNDAVYGDQPPVMAVDLMRGPRKLVFNPDTLIELGLTHAMLVNNPDQLFNFQYYQLLSGTDPNAGLVPNNGVVFPDNPNIPGGQSELAQNTTPGKRATLMSCGPFRVFPGAVDEVAVAYSFAEGPSPVAAVQQIFNQSNVQQNLFDNCFAPLPGQDLCGNTTDVPLGPTVLKAQIAPNPTTGLVRVQSASQPIVRVTVTDVQGRTVLSNQWSKGQDSLTLDLQQQASGVYFVRFESASGAVGVAKVVRLND